MACGGGDGWGCRGRDRRADAYIALCGGGSLLVPPAVSVSIIFEPEVRE